MDLVETLDLGLFDMLSYLTDQKQWLFFSFFLSFPLQSGAGGEGGEVLIFVCEGRLVAFCVTEY